MNNEFTKETTKKKHNYKSLLETKEINHSN
jgi:hypothetical protein